MKKLLKLFILVSIQTLILSISFSVNAAGRDGGFRSTSPRGGGSSDAGGFAFDVFGYRDDRTASQPGQYPYALSFYDVKLGYTLSNGLYFGAFYTTMSNTPGFGGGSTIDTMTGYGALVGFRHSGFVIDGEYYISSTFNLASGSTYNSGSSSQAFIGYDVTVSGGFHVGFGYAYRSFGYTQQTTSGIATAQNTNLTYGHPCLSMGYQF